MYQICNWKVSGTFISDVSGAFETKFHLFNKSLVIIPAITVIKSFLLQINGIALYGWAAKKILSLQADNRAELWGQRTVY